IDVVDCHSDTLYAHPEGEPRILLRVVVDEAVHVRIDHAAAKQLDPATGLAQATRDAVKASGTAAFEAGDCNLSAGFGEREERRLEFGLCRRSKQLLHRVLERALQIAESNVGVDA